MEQQSITSARIGSVLDLTILNWPLAPRTLCAVTDGELGMHEKRTAREGTSLLEKTFTPIQVVSDAVKNAEASRSGSQINDPKDGTGRGDPVPRQVVLLIRGDVAEMTPNRRMHYRERDRLRDKWKLLTLNAWNEERRSMIPGRVRISYRVFRGRLLDERNLLASLCFKAMEDALIGKAYPNDSPRYVESGLVTQITSMAFRPAPVVEMILEEIDDDC